MGLVKFKEGSSHWYLPNKTTGVLEPKHEWTLREARKHGAYPSVTTIEKDIRASRALDWYKAEQLSRAFLSVQRTPGELDESYVERVMAESDTHRDDAADFGTRVHKAIEEWPAPCADPEIAPFYSAFKSWYEEEFEDRLGQEEILCHHGVGVAGRMDQIAISRKHGLLLVDFKTQGVKVQGKPNFYSSWCRQLAFYRQCWFEQHQQLPHCASVIIDKLRPGTPLMHVWTREELDVGWTEFLCTAWLFFSDRAWWPTGKWEPKFDFPFA